MTLASGASLVEINGSCKAFHTRGAGAHDPARYGLPITVVQLAVSALYVLVLSRLM